MKKFISCILAAAMLCCSVVAFAVEKEVVIDTEVPVFRDLTDGLSYVTNSKKIEIADLSKVDCVLMRAGNGTVSFAGKTFSGYTKITEAQNLECINYTAIATVTQEGSYMVYAKDIYNHDIAVRFTIIDPEKNPTPGPNPGPNPGFGGGGGGGGGGIVKIKQPYANGEPENTKGTLPAGKKITLASDTGNVKIYYTTDGTAPTIKSILYDATKGIILTEGQTLKAVAVKSGILSSISVWTCPVTGGSGDNTNSGGSIVKDTLETEEHIVYMTGYPDKTFAPNNNMTRAEAATMFARLMKVKMNPVAVYKSSFADVSSEAWYYNYVGYMAKLGIITGYEDETFRPQNTITRAEFVAMASRFVKISETFECSFKDIASGHWAYNYIAFAAGNKWIGGYEDNTFRADNTITRAEVVTIVNNMLVRNADKEYVNTNKAVLNMFVDISEEHWAYYDIVEATNEHTYKLTGDMEKWN